MRQINAANAITTRAALCDFLAHLLFTNVAHNTGQLQDYGIRGYSVAHMPPSMSITALPDPKAKFTMHKLMHAAPNADVQGREVRFVSVFNGAASITQLVPGTIDWDTGEAVPVWDADLPFPTNYSAADDAANAAIVQYRHALSDIFADTSQSRLVCLLSTNWGGPLVLPRVTYI